MSQRLSRGERQAVIVTDLGFGDAGKGLVTDFLVRALGAHTVVRFNGGAQAGHNVTTADGRHHTFAQIGAGSFVPGVRTHLSGRVIVHPTALLVEAAHLARKGVPDALRRLSISDEALFITPFHQAANRLRELARGGARHGSCGVGIGEAVKDAIEMGSEALRMKGLRDLGGLRRILLRAQARKREELAEVLRQLAGDPRAERELRALEAPACIDAWIGAVAALAEEATIAGDEVLGERLSEGGAVVFEGAQGVLLDEWHGFHPHTTWSTCTFELAISLLDEHRYAGEVTRLGVLRTYAVRHGAGPLPTEAPTLRGALPEPHNEDGPWQGPFRLGWPDLVLSRYALEACGGADALALTHLDAVARVQAFRVCRAYRLEQESDRCLFEAARDGAVHRIAVGSGRDLERQAALGRALARVKPIYEDLDAGGAARLTELFEASLGIPLRIAARGPTANDARWVGAAITRGA